LLLHRAVEGQECLWCRHLVRKLFRSRLEARTTILPARVANRLESFPDLRTARGEQLGLLIFRKLRQIRCGRDGELAGIDSFDQSGGAFLEDFTRTVDAEI